MNLQARSEESRLISGITFIEIIIVVTIIAVLSATTAPFVSGFILRNNLETAQDKVVSTIRKAQFYSMDGKNGSAWGICVRGTSIRLYRGDCDSPDFSEDLDYSSTISIVGLDDTTFSKLRGGPSNALNITVSSSIDSVNIQVNQAGAIDVN